MVDIDFDVGAISDDGDFCFFGEVCGEEGIIDGFHDVVGVAVENTFEFDRFVTADDEAVLIVAVGGSEENAIGALRSADFCADFNI